MTHQPASPPRRPAGPGIARAARRAAALTVTAAAVLAAGGPAALAVPLPPSDVSGPITPPPPTTTTAHLPLWAVAAIVTATIVLSVATTLITLSAERLWRARRSPAADAEPAASTGDILTSHHHRAGYNKYRAGSP